MFKTCILILSLLGSAYALEPNPDRFCLAENIYFEASIEPTVGKFAVAQVVMNRVESPQFPDDACAVIRQGPLYRNWKGNELPVPNKCQFSWYCDRKSDKILDVKMWRECLRVAEAVLNKELFDITEGSLWYHSVKVKPYWAASKTKVVQVNNHIFYN